MKLVFSRRCLEYGSPYHPENPERVRKAYDILKGLGYEFVEPTPAREEDLLRAHSRGYLEVIKAETFFDPDTHAYPHIYGYARLAAGGAIKAAELVGFSLMRPPGHHAGGNGLALGAPTPWFLLLQQHSGGRQKAGGFHPHRGHRWPPR